MTKILPRTLTTHDLLKTLALVTMISDHIGHYFFPEYVWLRVVGRFSAPVWFFLIGYADTRRVPWDWWAGAFIVALSRIVTGQFIFPLNTLFALAAARLMIDGIMARALKDGQSLWGMALLMFFLVLPTMALFEYGTAGLLFTMLGFLRRHGGRMGVPTLHQAAFAVIAAAVMLLLDFLMLWGLAAGPSVVLIGGSLGLTALLFVFRPAPLLRVTTALGPLAGVLRFTGRHTLEIYVIHLVAFSGLASLLWPRRFGFMDFIVVPPAY